MDISYSIDSQSAAVCESSKPLASQTSGSTTHQHHPFALDTDVGHAEQRRGLIRIGWVRAVAIGRPPRSSGKEFIVDHTIRDWQTRILIWSR